METQGKIYPGLRDGMNDGIATVPGNMSKVSPSNFNSWLGGGLESC